MKLLKSLAVSVVALLFATTVHAKEVTLLMDWFPQGNQSVFWQAMLVNDEHDLKIIVKPGGILSLQSHKFRSEHWVVVDGAALVEVDGKETLVFENQSTYIPANSIHRLSNPGKIPLRIIEVQSGSYLEEDDIERFDDSYGRS